MDVRPICRRCFEAMRLVGTRIDSRMAANDTEEHVLLLDYVCVECRCTVTLRITGGA